LIDIGIWDRQAFSLWGDGFVTAHDGSALSLTGNIGNADLREIRPRRFFAVARDTHRDDGVLPAGFYLLGDRGVRVLENGAWRDTPHRDLLREHAADPPVYQAGKLRLTPRAGKGFDFAYLDTSDRWRTIPWRDGRVAIDRWDAVIQDGRRLWAATPLGLLAMDRTPRATLDPDEVRIDPSLMTGIDPKRGTAPRVTDLERFTDGLMARFTDGNLRLSEAGPGAPPGFTEADRAGDPFESRLMVDLSTNGDPFLKVEARGRLPGRAGFLDIAFRGRQVDIAAGRFPFDQLTSLAFPEPGTLDLAVSGGGWYRFPSEDMVLERYRHPDINGIDEESVTAVGIAVAGDHLELSLRTEDRTHLWEPESEPDTVRTALGHMGSDGFWSYGKDGDSLVIRPAAGIGTGNGNRRLEAGRFGDDVAIGLPVVAREGTTARIWVPTRDGVVGYDAGMNRVAIHVPPFDGLTEGEAPNAVAALSDRLYYATPTGIHGLTLRREPVFDLPIEGGGAEIVRFEAGPYETL